MAAAYTLWTRFTNMLLHKLGFGVKKVFTGSNRFATDAVKHVSQGELIRCKT